MNIPPHSIVSPGVSGLCCPLQVVLKSEPVHPFGLAVYGDYIFWTDWVRRAVLRADKYVGGDMKLLRADIPQQPMGIVAVANDTNSCEWGRRPSGRAGSSEDRSQIKLHEREVTEVI